MAAPRAQTDIEINGVPLMLYRTPAKAPGADYDPAELEWGFGTVDAASRIQTQVVPRRWVDWSGGMGFAKQPGDPQQTGVYHYGINVCTRYSGIVTPGGLVTPVILPGTVTQAPRAAYEWGDDLCFLCGRYVVQLDNGSGSPHIVQDFGASFEAHSATTFQLPDGRPCIVVGGLDVASQTPGFVWTYDGTVWTRSTTVTGRFIDTVKWDAGGLTAERLVVTDTHQTFKYTAVDHANPLNASDYSVSLRVCDPTAQIRSVARFPERFFPVCSDGIRDVAADDSGDLQVRNLTPYWRKQLHPSNGMYCLAARNHILASFAGGTDSIDVTNLQRQDEPMWADVGAYLPNESSIYGTGPFALDRGWVVQAKYDSGQGDCHVCYAADRSQVNRPGPGPLVWHGSEATLTPDISVGADLVPRFLHLAAPNGDPRMWISCQAGTVPHLNWLSLPRAQTPLQDWLNGGPMRFAPVGSLFNATETWGAASDQKILQWFTLQTRNLGGGALIELYANAEHGLFIGQGVARSSPRTRVTPKGEVVNGYSIGTEIVFKSNPTVPAIMEELAVFAEVNADLAEQRKYPIVIARGNRTRTPALEYRVPENVWRLISPLQQAGPVTLKDEFGEILQASVQPGIGGKTIEDEDGRGWTRVVSLVLTILSTAGGRILHYGVGERWGAGYVYGSHALGGEVLHYGVGMTWGRGYVWGSDT